MPGFIVYQGPSEIDGGPIIGVLTLGSDNPKTGPMDQLYILRADSHPREALDLGTDLSVCGSCPLRGPACYVQLHRGPSAVWGAFKRGRYVSLQTLEDVAQAGEGRRIRLGAYGDPAAIPFPVLSALVSRAEGWTGYTHQWRNRKLKAALTLCQASLDRPRDRETLDRIAPGAGSFRVLAPGETLLEGEILCLNVTSGVQCADCQLCNGRSGIRVAIPAHGPGKSQFTVQRERKTSHVPTP